MCLGQMQPLRKLSKGEGWINESFIDPTNNKVLKVNSYTEDQLDAMMKQLEEQYTKAQNNIVEMKNLLKSEPKKEEEN